MVADILPSSLARETRDVIFGEHPFADGKIAWVPTFCASCSKQGPRVPEVSIQSGGFVCWMCEPCAEKLGPETLLMKVPDEVFWQKLSEAQEDHYGRQLTNDELEIELDDVNSVISRLARERPGY